MKLQTILGLLVLAAAGGPLLWRVTADVRACLVDLLLWVDELADDGWRGLDVIAAVVVTVACACIALV